MDSDIPASFDTEHLWTLLPQDIGRNSYCSLFENVDEKKDGTLWSCQRLLKERRGIHMVL